MKLPSFFIARNAERIISITSRNLFLSDAFFSIFNFPSRLTLKACKNVPVPATLQTIWNKGHVVGKKPPLTPDQVALIRLILRQEKALRSITSPDARSRAA